MNDPYRPVGLLPPAGPVRVRVLTIVGVPLLLIVALALLTGLGSGSEDPYSGAPSGQGGFWSGSTDGTDGYASQSATPPLFEPSPEDPGTALPTDTPSYDSSPSPSASSSTDTPVTGPGATVQSYFEAIDSGDYATAWDLGGSNLDSDYDTFVAGFVDTAHVTVTILSVKGDVVKVTLESVQNNATRNNYRGTYTVRDGVITDASVKETS